MGWGRSSYDSGVSGWGRSSGRARSVEPAWGRSRTYVDDDDAAPAIGSAGWGQSREAQRLQRGTRAAAGNEFPAEEPPPAPSFAEGDRVRHPKFGEGLVTAVRGDTLTIQFPGVGQKLLVAGYVQKVGE